MGQRHSDYAALEAAVSAGDVRQVTVVDALPPGSTGYGLVKVTWHDDGIEHLAEVWQIGSDQGAGAATSTPPDGDVGQQLRALRPDLQVAAAARPAVVGDIFGWRVPVWLSLTAVAIGLGHLVVLVRGPRPYWATRWAWFWLSWGYVGAAVFLLLSGPAPGLPAPREGSRRLTGGWAFLVSAVLGTGTTSVMG